MLLSRTVQFFCLLHWLIHEIQALMSFLCVSDQKNWFMAQMGVARPCRPGFALWCNRLNDSCQSNEVSIHSGLRFDRHVMVKVSDVSPLSLRSCVFICASHVVPADEPHECQSHTPASQTFISDCTTCHFKEAGSAIPLRDRAARPYGLFIVLFHLLSAYSCTVVIFTPVVSRSGCIMGRTRHMCHCSTVNGCVSECFYCQKY